MLEVPLQTLAGAMATRQGWSRLGVALIAFRSARTYSSSSSAGSGLLGSRDPR